VAAGILRDADGRVLITERVGGGPFHGLWEFPGGKLLDGESPEAALERELREEIGIETLVRETFMRIAHDYADRSVAIDFFLVHEWRNEPIGLEGQQLEWVSPARLEAGRLLPANVPIIEALRRR
jgi:8-oxo-dGTP diphosphatase